MEPLTILALALVAASLSAPLTAYLVLRHLPARVESQEQARAEGRRQDRRLRLEEEAAELQRDLLQLQIDRSRVQVELEAVRAKPYMEGRASPNPHA